MFAGNLLPPPRTQREDRHPKVAPAARAVAPAAVIVVAAAAAVVVAVAAAAAAAAAAVVAAVAVAVAAAAEGELDPNVALSSDGTTNAVLVSSNPMKATKTFSVTCLQLQMAML